MGKNIWLKLNSDSGSLKFSYPVLIKKFKGHTNRINFISQNMVSGVYLYSINAEEKDNPLSILLKS